MSKYKEILFSKVINIVIFVVIALAGFMLINHLFCNNDKPYEFTTLPTLFTDEPIIVPDTLPPWSDYDNELVSEIVATTEEGDVAHIVITYDPTTETVIVSGTINDNPITEANVEIVIPVYPKVYREELGDWAVTIQHSFKGAETTLLGINYDLVHLCRGRLRFGVNAMLDPIGFDNGAIGIRTAGRLGNLSIGVTNGVDQNLKYSVGVNLGFYI